MLAILAVALCPPAVAQEEMPPLLADLTHLQLKVTTVEAVEELRTADIGGETVIAPDDDEVLLVVTLEGMAQESWRVPFQTDGFSAIYEAPETFGDEVEMRPEIRRSSGVAWEREGDPSRWLLKPERGNIMCTQYAREPGPVAIKVAFVIPADAESFTVRVPSSAGVAEVPEL